ncbi:MAG: MarR family transcriptional regulator [Planctomycetota bacterium]
MFLNLILTADQLAREQDELLRSHQISSEQYNVLRILRGAGESGLTCTEIGARMLTRSPDITRLLDKLEGRGLIVRTRSNEDRRIVRATIASVGLSVLRILDNPLQELHRASLRHMSRADLAKALELLEAMRTSVKRTDRD